MRFLDGGSYGAGERIRGLGQRQRRDDDQTRPSIFAMGTVTRDDAQGPDGCQNRAHMEPDTSG